MLRMQISVRYDLQLSSISQSGPQTDKLKMRYEW